jgi:hypothetical protein
MAEANFRFLSLSTNRSEQFSKKKQLSVQNLQIWSNNSAAAFRLLN